MSGLVADRVTVAYPGHIALDSVSLRVRFGRIHVLVGENGAGKSTMIKVLTGSRRPEAGTLLLEDTPLSFHNPDDAARAGIRSVPQELLVFPSLTVWENVTAGMRSGALGTVKRSTLRARAAEALAMIGAEDTPLDAQVGDLTPAQQQRIVIAHALAENVRFLILDEPTATLSRVERDELLELLRKLAARGVGILFVSHFLVEVLAIGDDISVLRDGKLVWTRERPEVDEQALVTAMFGERTWQEERAISRRAGSTAAAEEASPDSVLTASALQWHPGQAPLDLSVLPGEILGIAGLPGTGADTLNSALIGAVRRRGQVMLGDKLLPSTVSGCIAAGVGLIPSDRKALGLFMTRSVTDNICAAELSDVSHLGFLDGREMVRRTRRFVEQLHIQPPRPAMSVQELSGGNQQKVMVARWLRGQVRILLGDEPTRGTDVATRVQIHGLLRSIADGGTPCVVYSSDLQELTDLADRILVLRRRGQPQIIDAKVPPDLLYEAMSGRRMHTGERAV